MTITLLYAGPLDSAEAWRTHVAGYAAEAGLAVEVVTGADVGAADYVIYAPNEDGDPSEKPDLRRVSGLKAIFSLWAGVETLITRDDLPAGVPVARMVEPGLTIGMTDYVVGHAMRYHIGVDQSIARSAAGRWDGAHPPLSIHRRVGVMGLGALGRDAAEKLSALRFDVRGWSRTPRDIPGVSCFAGMDALPEFLSGADILIMLLPLTAETQGLMNAERLAHLPTGACLINAARGPILDEAALITALDSNISYATLDVFDTEPLPENHPYWRHDRITVTPHIASVTRPETASKEIIAQIQRCERGEPLLHLVDFTQGY